MDCKLLFGSSMLMCLLLLSGCTDEWRDRPYLYKDIASAEIPQDCIQYENDICTLYECMVDDCYCDELHEPSAILYEPSEVIITTEEEAVQHVHSFVSEQSVEYANFSEVTFAVHLNTIFYNVFAENSIGDEMTFVVSVDGIIFLSLCNV